MTDTVENMPRWRLLVLALLVVGALWTLIARLHTLQVKQSDDFESSQIRQSVRRVLLPAPRGRIFDRNGLCLADNRPSYCIAVYAEELRKPGAWSNTVNAVDARIDELSAALGIERQISRADIRQHVAKRLPLPLLAWQDIDERTLARFSEEFANDPGMDVYVQPERVYPHGALAAPFFASLRDPAVLALPPGALSSLTRRTPDGEEQTVRLGGEGAWFSAKPPAVADRAAAEALSGLLTNLVSSGAATLFTSDSAAYGLLPPRLEIVASTTLTNRPVVILQLGSALPDGSTYLRIRGEDPVFTLPPDAAATLSAPLLQTR